METQPYWRLGRGSNPLAISRLTDNPCSTARRKARPDGNRTHISRAEPGRSLAVELLECPALALDFNAGPGCGLVRRQLSAARSVRQMGKWRDRRRHSHAGNRTRTARLAPRRYALLMVEDNRSTSAHLNRNGQEAGICTRTVSFTGRDAARYTTILRNGVHGRNCTCDLGLRRAAL